MVLADRPKLVVLIYQATVAKSPSDGSLEALKLSRRVGAGSTAGKVRILEDDEK